MREALEDGDGHGDGHGGEMGWKMEVTILKNEKGIVRGSTGTDLRENLLYQSFKHLWNNRQLKTIYFLFQELDYLESKTGEDGVIHKKSLHSGYRNNTRYERKCGDTFYYTCHYSYYNFVTRDNRGYLY